eukprot:CAMPEP_0197852100 /NCGR_PEP_ID=MMETSP1438-20131217/19640_1 /TAXON_ID=1461541 /ORGANISM="Pterosperma sp., Strain CCMP1384" /LENGTH=113 /DNA_ID=CAMNT_0043465967 /DNA_START=269 /DNA_END=607 /DNA_ORIENTATION=+
MLCHVSLHSPATCQVASCHIGSSPASRARHVSKSPTAVVCVSRYGAAFKREAQGVQVGGAVPRWNVELRGHPQGRVLGLKVRSDFERRKDEFQDKFKKSAKSEVGGAIGGAMV